LKAMVLDGVKQMKLVELPDPEPGPDEVIVKVAYCGVCMTDVHMYFGEFPVKTPVVLGHECSGIISKVGKEVTRVSIGDHIALNPIIHCGVCEYCLGGRTNLCENGLVVGGAGERIINGAYAEYVKVPERNVIKYDKHVPLKYSSLTEPLACVIHGIRLTGIEIGNSVVIIGAGPIGLLFTQLLAISGSSRIIVLDLKNERLKVAEKMGASHVINPKETNDVAKDIKESLDGSLADVVIEAVGSIATVKEAFRYVKKGGKILIFGVPPKGALTTFSPFDVYFTELKVIGAYAFATEDFKKSVAMISSNRVNLDPLITEIYPLEQLEKAFESAKRGDGLKKLISVSGD